jgi:hypothetical protein
MFCCFWTTVLILQVPRLLRAADSGQVRYKSPSNASLSYGYERSLSSLKTLRSNRPIDAVDPQSAAVANQYIVYFSDDWIKEQATFGAAATSSRVTYNASASQGRIIAVVEQTAAQVARATGGSILWIYRHAFYGVALTNVTKTLVTTRTSGSQSSAASRTALWQHEYIDRIQQVRGYSQSAMFTPPE